MPLIRKGAMCSQDQMCWFLHTQLASSKIDPCLANALLLCRPYPRTAFGADWSTKGHDVLLLGCALSPSLPQGDSILASVLARHGWAASPSGRSSEPAAEGQSSLQGSQACLCGVKSSHKTRKASLHRESPAEYGTQGSGSPGDTG